MDDSAWPGGNDWIKDHIPDPRDTSFTEDLGKAKRTMIDDPRAILEAAGVECAEVETFYGPHSYADEVDVSVCFEERDAAILAVARLAAEFKRQLDDRTERVKQAIEQSRVTGVSPQEVLDLIDRIVKLQDDEKRDAYLAAKYKWQRGKLAGRLLAERLTTDVRGLSGEDEQRMIRAAYEWKDRICVDLDRRWKEHNA